MSVQTAKRLKKEAALESKPSHNERDAETHVPEWAEDMEHTLRRLTEEKQVKRDKQPGLYL